MPIGGNSKRGQDGFPADLKNSTRSRHNSGDYDNVLDARETFSLDKQQSGKPRRPRHLDLTRSGQRSGQLTSILKNKNTPSPGDCAQTGYEVEGIEGVASHFMDTLAVPPRTPQGRRGSGQFNPILARCAKLKNEAGYGSFSFQQREMLQFTRQSRRSTDRDDSSPNRKSDSSSGSCSPLPGPRGSEGQRSCGTKRARFSEEVS